MDDKARAVRCSECNGRKVIVGAGYMDKKCSNCDGEGFFLEKIEEIVARHEPAAEKESIDTSPSLMDLATNSETGEMNKILPKRKRGRPPKQ